MHIKDISMRFFPVLLISLLLMSCSHEKLIFVEKNDEAGFHYPYYLFISDGASEEDSPVLIVEPNNSGFVSDDFQKHAEKAKRTATKDFYLGNYMARKLNYPLLVPVFPRPESNWKIYAHALDRDVILQKGNDLERIDLQLIAMIDDARKRLSQLNHSTNEKILITGFSASGTFVNRFSLIHPDFIMAAAAGGVNGLLMLPVGQLEGKELNYPIGINNFKQLFGYDFDTASFRKVPMFLFMGELDTNDAIPYEDGYDPDERDLVFTVLGEKMQPDRWNKCINIYKEKGINAEIKTFSGTGHEHTDLIKEEILSFFRNCMKAEPENALADRE